MFDRKKDIDIKELNQILVITKKVLHVVYVMSLFIGLYLFIKIGKELNLFEGIFTILKIVTPLFVGLIIAWLFDPIADYMQKYHIKRGFAACIIYLVMLLIIFILFICVIPSLYGQINDFVQTVPSIYESFKNWFDDIFIRLDKINGINAIEIENEILKKISNYGNDFIQTLPTTLIGIFSSMISGLGQIALSLIIGFFFLIGFENKQAIIEFLPSKMQKNTRELLNEIDQACRSFVTGSILDCTFIFMISSIGLWFVGLKAPLLFGLFCGITNIIPYLGPYLGGIPAVIVGFTQSTTIGILTLVVIAVIQLLEGNLLQPLILSKTTKLHPITIILGLLIFGYFFNIVGMIISTPIIAALKAVVLYFDKKYDILKFN